MTVGELCTTRNRYILSKLFFLFIITPLIELALLIEMGNTLELLKTLKFGF